MRWKGSGTRRVKFVAVNITGCSGFGFFNSVSQTNLWPRACRLWKSEQLHASPPISIPRVLGHPFPQNILVHFLDLEAGELESLPMGS